MRTGKLALMAAIAPKIAEARAWDEQAPTWAMRGH